MCFFLENPPTYKHRNGIVIIRDAAGERAMSLGTFAADARNRISLSRQWVADANKPARVRRLKKIEVAEAGHR